MNPKILLPAVLLATAAVGAGYYLGSRATPSPTVATSGPVTSGKKTEAPLPKPPATASPLKRIDITHKPTVAEVTPLVEHAAQTGRWNMNKRWEIIINALESPDFPPLLAVLAKHGPSFAKMQLTTVMPAPPSRTRRL